MIILAIILIGMVVGAAAQVVLGRSGRGIDWGMALGAGLIGSFVGGMILSLLFGDGFSLKPSSIIGSLLGAVIVTYVWRRLEGKKTAQAPAGRRR